MFNYKGATNLVGFLNALKVISIVLSLLWGIGGGLFTAVRVAESTGSDGLGTAAFVFMAVLGVFWAMVSWALFGLAQHHLAAVSYTAFQAGEQAKLRPIGY